MLQGMEQRRLTFLTAGITAVSLCEMTLLPRGYARKDLRTAEIDIVEMRGECCRIRCATMDSRIRMMNDPGFHVFLPPISPFPGPGFIPWV
jgi:hypothetical protein